MLESFGDLSAAFGLTIVSELGDKSQLLMVGLAARWPRWPVALGGVVGTAGVQLLAVMVGDRVGDLGLDRVLPAVVGAVFVVLGVLLIGNGRSDIDASDDTDGSSVAANVGEERSAGAAFLSTTGLLFLAELGDKTMFTTAALASVRTPWAVLAGATAAFAVLAVVAATVGQTLADRIDERLLRLVGGAIFVLTGLVTLGITAVG